MIQSPVQILSEDAQVANLINGEVKQWNRELVTEVFGPDIAAVIQRIPVSSTGARDKLMW